MKLPIISNIDFSRFPQILKNTDLMVRIAIIVLAIFLARNLLKDSMKEKQSLDSSIIEQQKAVNIINQIKAQRKTLKEYAQLYGDKYSPSFVMKKIQSLEKVSDVSVLTIRPEGFKEVDLWVTLPFSITVEGSFHKLASFLGKLESEGWFIQVSSLDFDMKGKGVMAIRVLMSVLYLKG